MALTSKQKYELKKFIKGLSKYKGRHTELVSVYIPSGYDINKIISHLSQEQGTATNIKSTSTRKNVIDALERMIRHLRLFKATPKNGLAAFSGNISPKEGAPKIEVFSIEPPVPFKIRIYRCDKEFVLEPMDKMLEHKEVYGLVVIDRRDADIAFLKGKTIIHLVKTHSHVPGKIKAGGQCCIPSTLIETNSKTPLSKLKIGDQLKSYNFKENKIIKSKIIDKWIVKKEGIIKTTTEDNTMIYTSNDHLFFTEDKKEKPAEKLTTNDSLLKIKNNKACPVKIKSIEIINKPTKMVDISVKNQNFIANGIIVHNSAARYARITEGARKDHFKKVAEYIKEQFLGKKTLKGVIVGGPGPTKYDFVEGHFIPTEIKDKIIAIKDISYTGDFGIQELVDKSQDVLAKEEIAAEKEIMGKFFELLAKQPGKVSYGEEEVIKNLQIGAVETLLLSEELEDQKIDQFEKQAEKVKTTVKIISTETREGVQLRDIGKIAAILRYEVS